MPAITPVYSWPYPALGDPPNVPSDISKLALAIEPTMKAANDKILALQNGVLDTGWINDASWWTPSGTWTNNAANRVRKVGHKIRAEFSLLRSGASITASASGSMVVTVGQLAVGWRPTQSQRHVFVYANGVGALSIASDGSVSTVCYVPGQTINQGASIIADAEWYDN